MSHAPIRLQLSRHKGFNLQAHSRAVNGLAAVKVDRTTLFGNPFRIGEPCDRKIIRRWGWDFKHPEFVCDDAETAVRRFRGCIGKDEAIWPFVREHIAGKNLACWCSALAPCHADVLLEIANR